MLSPDESVDSEMMERTKECSAKAVGQERSTKARNASQSSDDEVFVQVLSQMGYSFKLLRL